MAIITDHAHTDLNKLGSLKIGIVNNEEVKTYYRHDDLEVLTFMRESLESDQFSFEEMYLDKSAFETKVFDILKYEFREGLKSFLQERSDFPIRHIGDVIDFNKKDMSKFAPYNHEIIKQAYEESYEREVIEKQILENQKLTRDALEKAFQTYDFLVTLSNYCTSVYAPSGYPAINIPLMKRKTGEPIGMTIIGKYMEDEKLIAVATQFDKLLREGGNDA
jgi:amidase